MATCAYAEVSPGVRVCVEMLVRRCLHVQMRVCMGTLSTSSYTSTGQWTCTSRCCPAWCAPRSHSSSAPRAGAHDHHPKARSPSHGRLWWGWPAPESRLDHRLCGLRFPPQKWQNGHGSWQSQGSACSSKEGASASQGAQSAGEDRCGENRYIAATWAVHSCQLSPYLAPPQLLLFAQCLPPGRWYCPVAASFLGGGGGVRPS